jgi:hypothetical protein
MLLGKLKSQFNQVNGPEPDHRRHTADIGGHVRQNKINTPTCKRSFQQLGG